MTQTEALKLALEALKYHTEQTRPIGKTNEVMAVIEEVLNYSECNCNQGQSCHVCDPIHPALAQPAVAEQHKQEPLEYWNAVEGWVKIDEVREHFDSVGCGTIYKTAGEGREPLYTTPPQRKPLPREVIDRDFYGRIDFVRQVEAAHGIKE